MALNVVFSFDTTGSMSGCIGQVRLKISEIVNDLFGKIDNLSVGIVAHGDYDAEYLYKQVDITTNKKELSDFVKDVPNTTGRSYPEAYEYVLNKVQEMSWQPSALKILVMVGDAIPHEDHDNPHKLKWRNELEKLKNMEISVYSVQCLNSNNGSTKMFWKTMASVTGGYHLYLNQFSFITEMMTAICFKSMGTESLELYQQELETSSRITDNLKNMFNILLGKSTTEDIEREEETRYDWGSSSSSSSSTTVSARVDRTVDLGIDATSATLVPCRPSRFQSLNVTEDTDIKKFVSDNGLTFKKGRGFYQFTKPELIQKNKEIVLRRKDNLTFYEGDKARVMLKLVTYDTGKKIKNTDFPEYDVFIQSNSYNRKLISGTIFIYDSEE